PADARAGMNLYAGEEAGAVAHHARQRRPPVPPQPVREAVKLHRVKPGVGEYHVPLGTHRRVTLEDRLDVLFNVPPEHNKPSALGGQRAIVTRSDRFHSALITQYPVLFWLLAGG